MSSFLISLSAFILIFISYSYYNYRRVKKLSGLPDSDKIITLTNSNFGHHTKNGIVLIDFWASWCMPCKMMAPIINELAESIDPSTTVAKLNVEEFQQLASNYNVRSIPTLIILKDGKEVERFSGVKSKDFLMKKLSAVG